MDRKTSLILSLTVLSILSGYLMSKASLVGRAGMSLFYREYNFLKTWWKGAVAVFVVLMLLYALHRLLERKLTAAKARTVHICALAIAVAGLYFTYNDFRHTLSHRLLGERFHLGVYIFWLGWILVIVHYLWRQSTSKTPEVLQPKNPHQAGNNDISRKQL